MNPYCWVCDRYTQEDPDHFNRDGECAAQMKAHVSERKKFWEEALSPSDSNADKTNKLKAENIHNLDQPTYDPNKHKWGGVV